MRHIGRSQQRVRRRHDVCSVVPGWKVGLRVMMPCRLMECWIFGSFSDEANDGFQGHFRRPKRRYSPAYQASSQTCHDRMERIVLSSVGGPPRLDGAQKSRKYEPLCLLYWFTLTSGGNIWDPLGPTAIELCKNCHYKHGRSGTMSTRLSAFAGGKSL
ncbi:hypothetical protein GY45DRAFT_1324864, partial [Cubamyces sp. BRFM 1775]